MIRLRKTIAVLCILAVSCLSLCAMTVEQLYAKALENSKTVFEMQKTRYFDFLDSVMASMGGPSWQISLQGAEFSFVDDFQGRTYQLPSLEVSYSSPEKPGKLTFNSSFNLSNIKFESSKDFKPGSFDISLHGGVSKSYEFKSWDATDYSKGWSDTVKAIEYDNSMLRFQNTFLQDIIDYLTLYKSGVKVAYEASVAASQNVQNLIEGKYKEDSEEGIRRGTEVKVKIKEQEQFEQSLKEKTAELTEKYGLTEEQLLEVEEAGTYDLSMTIADQGNYEVHSKYLEVLSLEQDFAPDFRLESRERSEQGRLAHPVGSDEARHPSFLERGIDILCHHSPCILHPIANAEMMQLYGIHNYLYFRAKLLKSCQNVKEGTEKLA